MVPGYGGATWPAARARRGHTLVSAEPNRVPVRGGPAQAADVPTAWTPQALDAVVAGASATAHDRFLPRGADPDLPPPGVLHPVRFDGDHAADRRPGARQQDRLRRAWSTTRRGGGVQGPGHLGAGERP